MNRGLWSSFRRAKDRLMPHGETRGKLQQISKAVTKRSGG